MEHIQYLQAKLAETWENVKTSVEVLSTQEDDHVLMDVENTNSGTGYISLPCDVASNTTSINDSTKKVSIAILIMRLSLRKTRYNSILNDAHKNHDDIPSIVAERIY